MDYGTVSPVLQRLEQRGMLTRRRCDVDERTVVVELTSSGRALRAKAEPIPAVIGCAVGMDAEERRDLIAILRAVTESVRRHAAVGAATTRECPKQTRTNRVRRPAMPSRNATTHWIGGISKGRGTVTLDSSDAGRYEISFPTRAGDPEGHTSPEELIAAAHSGCLAMNLSGVLENENLEVTSIDVSAEVTIDKAAGGGFEIPKIDITLRAKVPGVDADRFAELAKTAERTCPVSKALAGTTINLDAALDS